MHLLVMTPYYPPDISGAGRYVADLVAAVIERGDEVTVLHLGRSPDAPGGSPGAEVVAVNGRLRGQTSLAAVLEALRIHRSRPFDVVVSGLAHPIGVPAALVGRLTRTPVLTLVASEELAAPSRSRLRRRALRFTFDSSAQVAANSSATRRDVVRLGGRPERVVMLPPAVDGTALVERSDGLRRARRTVDGESPVHRGRTVVTVARLEARKGHDVVMRALQQLGGDYSDVGYLVIGPGDPSGIVEMSRSLGLDGRVTVEQGLSNDELVEAYTAADVFAMVSRPGPDGAIEGFGIVYLEAAACSLPCVAGDLGGCPDAVEDGVTGLLVDPREPAEVAAALKALLDDPARARHMGSLGRDRVLSEFSLSAFSARVHEIVDRCASPESPLARGRAVVATGPV